MRPIVACNAGRGNETPWWGDGLVPELGLLASGSFARLPFSERVCRCYCKVVGQYHNLNWTSFPGPDLYYDTVNRHQYDIAEDRRTLLFSYSTHTMHSAQTSIE